MKEYISNLEKGELHVHLNGLVSTSTIQKIIIDESIELPQNFNIHRDLVREFPMESLETYLKPWEVLRLIPNSRESLKLMVYNAFENLKEQNVSFVEIRNSIVYLSFLNGISTDTALRWLIEEIEQASEKYNIKAGLIMTISRGDYSGENFHTLMKAYEILDKPQAVLGLDLAGNENITISKHISNLFRSAKDKYGLNITVHAGETGNVANIIEAIDQFNADRIGHGTAAEMNKELMAYIKEKNVCIEVCPISNRLTGAVKNSDQHPVVEFLKNEVPFVICSDNPAIHNKTISDDYMSFYDETGRKDILASMFEIQKNYSFIKGL
ncbi:amidohydrolase family protein [Aliarcobacter butzleri]|uniref:adenosine deaminase family protein n=1 Tax=Aliarcobacter butzleri TaxID=28197 RepID=UPI001EE01CF8|nr:amidohydrolase family protein [Aliarcobacter butzleri]MCG3703806.1 amidohydrolase family protein [Aliarcobacter butzleri]